MPTELAVRNPSSPRAVAVYLLAVRPRLQEAIGTRRELIRGIGRLLAAAGEGHTRGVAMTAGRVGGEHVAPFRQVRRSLDGLVVPPPCLAAHRALVGWLDAQIATCQLMVEVRATGAVTRLPETQRHLAEGRAHGRRFNAEYARLVADLRREVGAARRRGRMRTGTRGRTKAALGRPRARAA
jgi:HAMP domain-containing protein